MLVKFKNFNQYSDQYSSDVNTFINKVGIATNEDIDFPYFNYIKNQYDLKETYDNFPIIIADDYMYESSSLNESKFTYNLNKTPSFDKVLEDFNGSKFIPSYTNDIKNVKKLKFPITAINDEGEISYSTVGKLRASEGIYERFTEKIVPKTKFTILSFKGKPISAIETINRFPLDVDLSRFEFIKEVKDISKQLHDKYNLDFYNVELIESVKGGLYINNVNRKLNLNPHQAITVYEAAYGDYYSARVPKWVKEQMINESVSKYYKQKHFDSMLIKSNHTLNYKKYINYDKN
jgi:hypothetical protein